MSFWDAYDFWRDAVAGTLIAAAMLGYLGVHVLLRRVVFVGAALTQVSGVGIAASFWLASFLALPDAHQPDHPLWLSPQLFALAFALGAALLFSLVREGRRLSVEAVVGLGWVLASAALLLVLSSGRIVQEAHEVDDLLYGNAVLISPAQVRLLAGVASAVLAVHLLFFRQFMFVSYDAEMARTLGHRTRLVDLALFATLGVGISFAVRVLGALPAFGFLVVPAASALLLVRRAHHAFPLAALFGAAGGALGYYLAFTQSYPTGAAMVAASSLFLLPGALLRLVRRS